MKVVVSGVAGFIGSHIADRLLNTGCEVEGFDNLLTGRADNVGNDVLFREADVQEPWETSLDGCDLVVHCAASYSDPNKWHRDTRTNVLGCINAAIFARETQARLLYFQTSLPPITSYAISKIAGQQFIELSGVPHVTFRLANIYGPRNLSGPIPAFFRNISAGTTSTVTTTERDMVFIDDLIDGVINTIDRPGVSGTIDMCSGINLTILSLYNEVVGALHSQMAPNVVAAHADDVSKMQLNRTRAATELDWKPTTDLRDGVLAAVRWYRENGVTNTYTHLKGH